MKQDEYKRLYDFEHFYWWHVGRRDIARTLLKIFFQTKTNQVLEIGCGTGGNMEMLSTFGEVTGLDPSEEALQFCKARGQNNVVLGRAEKTGFETESFDIVVALDVFEHIENEGAAFQESFRILKKGGYLIATVPAYQFLWSEHDEALGHKRRYRTSEFSDKLRGVGFEIVKTSYLITFLFPGILVYRMWRNVVSSKNKKTSYVVVSSWLNHFFIVLLRWEAFFLRFLNFPFGTSIICIARKPR